MKPVYIIVSKDPITIEERIKEITSTASQSEIVRYDLHEIPIQRVIEDLDTCNLFSSQKLIIASPAVFLSGEKTKGVVDHDITKLERYLENPSPVNILILVTDTLDKRKKITTTLSTSSTTQILEGEISPQEYIKQHLDDYQIDSKSINFLIEYCGCDSAKIMMEWEKLKLYKIDTKTINIQDIQTVVTKSIDDNIFTFIDNLLSGKKKEAFEIYQDLLLHGEQPTSILSKLANKIRLLYQVKTLLKTGKSDMEIAKLLAVHPYPVKLARESSYRYPENLLLAYLKKLSTIDLEMKSGKITDSVALEMMMASI